MRAEARLLTCRGQRDCICGRQRLKLLMYEALRVLDYEALRVLDNLEVNEIGFAVANDIENGGAVEK